MTVTCCECLSFQICGLRSLSVKMISYPVPFCHPDPSSMRKCNLRCSARKNLFWHSQQGFYWVLCSFLWNLILCCLMVTTAKATLHIHLLNHFFLCWEGASQLAFWSLMSINFLQQIHKLLDCLQLSLCPPRIFQEVEIPITTGEDMSLEFLSTN